MRPVSTIWPNTVSTSLISLVLAATACCVNVSPTRWANTDNRCVPGAPCFLEPRRVLPSTAMAISGASGTAGAVATTRSAQAPNLASNASRSTHRKMVCSVEAEGVSDIGAVVASPCGDGTVAPGATQHGAARQGEQSG